MQYMFSSETFTLKGNVTNETMIDVTELEAQAAPSWYMNREALPRMMKMILDGPHEKVNWLKQSQVETMRAYRDFFTHVAKNLKELTS